MLHRPLLRFLVFAFLCCLGGLLPGLWARWHATDWGWVRISGRVLVNGQPVTGGGMLLEMRDGEKYVTVIEEDGSFTFECLTGEVVVSVNNNELHVPENRRSEYKYKDGTIKRLQGKYVPLPRLRKFLTVVPGQYHYDIDLGVAD
jgi:hypothetical protein